MTGLTSAAVTRYGLLADRSLELVVDADLDDAVTGWVPLSSDTKPVAPPAGATHSDRKWRAPARIRVGGGDRSTEAIVAPDANQSPLLRLWSVRAWRASSPRTFTLYSARGRVSGYVDLERGSAELHLHPPVLAGSRSALFSALTLAAALLLLRGHRALMHAAAVAPPAGDAVLLAGDARAGKSTTAANLMSAGWTYLSDDHIVLRRMDTGAVEVEGWPRRFHLDTGWREARVLGERESVDPSGIGSGSFRRTARLGGVLFPRVEPGRGTRLEPIPAAESLALLIRQSPWLLTDSPTAERVLACLARVAALPSYRLFLDHDTYGDPERLAGILATMTG